MVSHKNGIGNRESELGLSLKLHNTDAHEDHERVEIKEKEEANKKLELASFAPSVQNKQQRPGDLGGSTGHVASPANRKARVSVRARCEAATVSFIYHIILIIFFINSLNECHKFKFYYI